MDEEIDYVNVPKTTEQNKDLKSYIIKKVVIGVVSAVLVLSVIVGIRTVTHYTVYMRGGTSPASTTTPATTCPIRLSCDRGWQLFETKCYYFSVSAQTWSFSRRTCQRLGGNLVKIEGREEQRFMFDQVSTLMESHEDKFWIGLTDAEVEGQWKWADGSPLNPSLTFWFKNRNQEEPDNWTGENPEGEDCVRMGEISKDFGEKCWFDHDCNAEQKFICEKEPSMSPNCQP